MMSFALGFKVRSKNHEDGSVTRVLTSLTTHQCPMKKDEHLVL